MKRSVWSITCEKKESTVLSDFNRVSNPGPMTLQLTVLPITPRDIGQKFSNFRLTVFTCPLDLPSLFWVIIAFT